MKKFLSAIEFNNIANIKATNCFAFALSLIEPNGLYELPRKDVDECYIKIEDAFEYRAAYHKIKVKEVNNLEETNGKIAFIVFGWYAYADFHVIRKNLDGTFEHKPDWKEAATKIEWNELRKEYPEEYHVFVFDE